MIADGGRESSSADPVAHYVDPLAEPELNPENNPTREQIRREP